MPRLQCPQAKQAVEAASHRRSPELQAVCRHQGLPVVFPSLLRPACRSHHPVRRPFRSQVCLARHPVASRPDLRRLVPVASRPRLDDRIDMAVAVAVGVAVGVATAMLMIIRRKSCLRRVKDTDLDLDLDLDLAREDG